METLLMLTTQPSPPTLPLQRCNPNPPPVNEWPSSVPVSIINHHPFLSCALEKCLFATSSFTCMQDGRQNDGDGHSYSISHRVPQSANTRPTLDAILMPSILCPRPRPRPRPRPALILTAS